MKYFNIEKKNEKKEEKAYMLSLRVNSNYQ